MEIKKYNYMPKEARAIRQKVFVEEQGFQEEFDEIDGQATHILVFDGERAVATCRFFFSLKLKGYLVGRIAVLKEYRGKRIGALMMEKTKECLQEIGVNGVFLHAQTHAIGFYEKQGFVSLGIEDEEEGHAHLWMKKEW